MYIYIVCKINDPPSNIWRQRTVVTENNPILFLCSTVARFRKSSTDHESSSPQLDEEHFPLRLDATKKHLFAAKYIDIHLVIDGLFEFVRALNSMTDAGV